MTSIIEKDWITQAGYRAVVLIVCDESGCKIHRCGYVGVSQGHSLYGRGYGDPLPEITQEQVDSVELGDKSPILIFTATVNSDSESKMRRSLDILIECHGGLTYAAGSETYPVSSDLWWFGFDCAHYNDQPIEHGFRWLHHEGQVRDLPFVEAECESIARQIKEYFP